MNSGLRSILSLSLLYISVACSVHATAQKVSGHYKNSPQFNDGGKTIDSLAAAYHVDEVEFENWDKNDLTDSCLTICLNNSDRAPKGPDFEHTPNEFKIIASAVKRSLARPEDYKSIYVIFVTNDRVRHIRTHTAGMNVLYMEL